MLTKADKTGPELFIVTPEMIQGVKNLAGIAKKHGNINTADFLTGVATGLTKVIAITKHVHEMAAMEKVIAKALNDAAGFAEQLYPMVSEKKEP
jgi:hypothetical protein